MPDQLKLSFEPVGHAQWESVREYLDDRVIPDYCHEKGVLKKYVAADLEMSPSDLSRKLRPSEGDQRNFSTDDLERWLKKTGNLKPLIYLFEKYSGLDEDRIARLEAELAEAKSSALHARARTA